MAGNNNPWRDIFSPAEWQRIVATAAPTLPPPPPPVLPPAPVVGPHVGVHLHPPPVLPPPPVAPPRLGVHRVAPPPAAVPPPVVAPPVAPPRVWAPARPNPAHVLQTISRQVTDYDAIPKDDFTRFAQRVASLRTIAASCQAYTNLLQAAQLGAKSPGGKQLADSLDVWVRSLESRAQKKAGYLTTMAQWHTGAKTKYKDKIQLSLFLRGLAADHTRQAGSKLHATPYATIEKIDPYHRQTFVFFDPADPSRDKSVNLMGEAFLEYFNGLAPSNPDRSTNANASFYEWLEYHPFCIGTPGITPGAENYKSPPRIYYDGHDLAFVCATPGQMIYERIISGPGVFYVLDSTDFRPSGKGGPGAVAFVWDADANLWLHEHGHDGFIHASAKQGKKIRCSGMLVAKDGKVTRITDESGHYAPLPLNLYHFADWLNTQSCLHPASDVRITHAAPPINKGLYRMPAFLSYFSRQGIASLNLPYPTTRP
jgi:hypothetical protein